MAEARKPTSPPRTPRKRKAPAAKTIERVTVNDIGEPWTLITQEKKSVASASTVEWWDRRWPGTALRLAELGAIAASAGAIVLTIQALDVANMQSELARRALDDQRESSAWQMLAIPNPAATGKQFALQTLVDLKADLVGVDLSCSAMTGNENGSSGCIRSRPNLFGLMLTRPPNSSASIGGSSFASTDLSQADFNRIDFVQTDFSDAWMTSSTISNTSFTSVSFKGAILDLSTFDNVILQGIDFSDAQLGATFKDVQAEKSSWDAGRRNVNISGALLCIEARLHDPAIGLRNCADGLDQSFFDMAWFYEDTPPKIYTNDDYLDGFSVAVCQRMSDGTNAVEVAKRMAVASSPGRPPDNCGEEDIRLLGQIRTRMVDTSR